MVVHLSTMDAPLIAMTSNQKIFPFKFAAASIQKRPLIKKYYLPPYAASIQERPVNESGHQWFGHGTHNISLFNFRFTLQRC